MKGSRGFISARKAAEYVGYEPGVDADGNALPVEEDKQMKCFYAWVRRHPGVAQKRGRSLVFRESDLDAAIGRSTQEEIERRDDRLAQMRELAVRAARGELGARVM